MSQPQVGNPTAAQLAGMTTNQKDAYTQDLNAADQRNTIDSIRRSSNAAYLANCVEKVAICPPAGGGINQAYAQGTTLTYNFPTAAGGYATDLLITMTMIITLAAGTAATYGNTAGSPWSVMSEIDILFNGTQARIRPYLLKMIGQLYYRGAPPPSNVDYGAPSTPAINTNVYSTFPTAVGANVWTFKFRVPLTVLHKLSAAGALPIQGASVRPQVVIQLNPSLLGPDPLLNAIYATGGTGNAVTTATGTVTAECIYRDGTNKASTQPLTLDISGPTAQYIIDTPLAPLAAGTTQRQRISTLLQHYYAIAVVIDGNASNVFAAVTNITQLELDQDSVGQNRFYVYGQNNVSIYDYWERTRRYFFQDFDQGVIPWVYAEGYGQENPDNRMGNQALNMTSGGWTDVNHGYVLTAVNGLGTVTPRVEMYLVSLNPEGLLTQ